MSHDENELQHIKFPRQSIHLQSQPHKKGCKVGRYHNRLNNRIGVVDGHQTDIKRCRMGYLNLDGTGNSNLVINPIKA